MNTTEPSKEALQAANQIAMHTSGDTRADFKMQTAVIQQAIDAALLSQRASILATLEKIAHDRGYDDEPIRHCINVLRAGDKEPAQSQETAIPLLQELQPIFDKHPRCGILAQGIRLIQHSPNIAPIALLLELIRYFAVENQELQAICERLLQVQSTAPVLVSPETVIRADPPQETSTDAGNEKENGFKFKVGQEVSVKGETGHWLITQHRAYKGKDFFTVIKAENLEVHSFPVISEDELEPIPTP